MILEIVAKNMKKIFVINIIEHYICKRLFKVLPDNKFGELPEWPKGHVC